MLSLTERKKERERSDNERDIETERKREGKELRTKEEKNRPYNFCLRHTAPESGRELARGFVLGREGF